MDQLWASWGWLKWRQQPLEQHWKEARTGTGNARGEQSTAVLLCVLGALERFMNWKAGLQESQPGFSAVFKLIRPGDPVLDNTKPVHTDVSAPHSTEPRNGELPVCDNSEQCSGWKASVN